MKQLVLTLTVIVSMVILFACSAQNNMTLNYTANTVRTGGHSAYAPVAQNLTNKNDNRGMLSGTTIVVDAGHGGFDAGAQGIVSKRAESDINLEIAEKLKDDLTMEGALVVMTREDKNAIAPSKDADMKKREDIISKTNPNIMISIHQNMYEDSAVYGPQVFYLKEGSTAENLAKTVQKSLNDALDIQKTRKAMSGDYSVLKPGTGPSIIVECGFLSNPKEDKLLQTDKYQNTIVGAIMDGVIEFVQSKN